jgi:hypothetical protein
MKQLILLWALALIVPCTALSQSQAVSLPTNAPLHYNPAFAGSQKGDRLIFNHGNDVLEQRDPVMLNGYFSYDRNSGALRGAVGVEANLNTRSNWSRWNLSGIYSPKFSLGQRWTFAPAIRLGVRRDRVVRWTGFGGDIINDPVSNYYGTLEIGALLNSRRFHLGINIANLGQVGLVLNDSAFFFQPSRSLVAQTGYLVDFGSEVPTYLSVDGLFEYQTWRYRGLLQALFRRSWFVVGAAVNYEWYDVIPHWGILPSIGVKQERFRIMASYHRLLTETFARIPNHSVELSFVWYFPHREPTASSGSTTN